MDTEAVIRKVWEADEEAIKGVREVSPKIVYLMDEATCVQDLLQYLSTEEDKTGEPQTEFIWIEGNGGEKVRLTGRQLHDQARHMAKRVLETGAKEGDRVALVYPFCFDFIVAFLACLYIGVLPVPMSPLNIFQLKEGEIQKFRHLVENSNSVMAMSTNEYCNGYSGLKLKVKVTRDKNRKLFPSIKWHAFEIVKKTKEADMVPEADIFRPKSSDDTAYLQYTSGSTSSPKGVMVTHRNYLHQIISVQKRYTDRERATKKKMDGVMNWAPFYHDMGLVFGFLNSLPQRRNVYMSPLSFLQNPLLFPDTLTKYNITTVTANNFCCVRIMQFVEKKKREQSSFDLSNINEHILGGDFAYPDAVHKYVKYFVGCGMDPNRLGSSWGQAEATCIVSGHLRNSPVRLLYVDQEELGKGKVVPVKHVPITEYAGEEEGTVALLSAGAPTVGMEIRIVDPDTGVEAAGDSVGELWVRGPSVTKGYWCNEEKTKETFQARLRPNPDAPAGEESWLRSGDLGFKHQGQIYITSRLKDVVIMHGRNLYPADIEPVLEEAHPMIRRGCLVITGLTEIDLGIMQNAKKRKAKHGDSVTERISKCKVKDGLLVAAIAELRTKEDYAKYAKDNYDGNDRREAMMKDTVVAIKKSMITSERIALQLVVLVEARSLPKTSSGKKRRAHVRQLLVDGKLNVLYVG
mmetsp:Transcript_35941/g.101127  ORF Transcript_35941/g.101127 Transcript_35941/m.101127 type:complete len:688 (+) Transcript_35941:60-2123(+)